MLCLTFGVFIWGRNLLGGNVFKLEKAQGKSIQVANKRINLWHGAVRSGKTWASLTAFIRFAAQYNNTYPLIISGKTDRTIERNVLEPLKMMCGDDLKYSLGSGTGMLFGCVNFVMIGANDRKAEGKIRGLTAGGGYGDEITLWPESYFKMWMTRLSVNGSKAFLTTNTDTPYHYLKTDYIDNMELDDFISFHFKISDNTTLSKEYVLALHKEYKGLWKKRLIDGLWVIAEGSIYDCYDDKRIEVTECPFTYDMWSTETIVCIDYGTTNACTFLKIKINRDKVSGSVSHIYVSDQYYFDSVKENRQKSDSEYYRDLDNFIGTDAIDSMIVDPSAASFIQEILNNGKYIPIDADNSVLDGVRFVYTLLSNGIMYINKLKCKHLIDELQGYVWDKSSQLSGVDAPKKEKDHSCDALRYGLYTVLGAEHAKTMFLQSMRCK